MHNHMKVEASSCEYNTTLWTTHTSPFLHINFDFFVSFLHLLLSCHRYLLNRSVFAIIYITICFFTAILGLKNAGIATALFFLVLMLMITYVFDSWITTKFVNPSTTLALTDARLIDEESKVSTYYNNF